MQTPYWLLEERLLKNNLELLEYIKDKTGVKILLALKGYALWQSSDLVSKYLDGCCASGLYEGYFIWMRSLQKRTHRYSPRVLRRGVWRGWPRFSNHLVLTHNSF